MYDIAIIAVQRQQLWTPGSVLTVARTMYLYVYYLSANAEWLYTGLVTSMRG